MSADEQFCERIVDEDRNGIDRHVLQPQTGAVPAVARKSTEVRVAFSVTFSGKLALDRTALFWPTYCPPGRWSTW
jgi:hypothetical protein